jgi:hypothetical protein
MSTGPDASLRTRLLDMADTARLRAQGSPVGEERDELLRKADDAGRSVVVGQWLTSPGMKLPT